MTAVYLVVINGDRNVIKKLAKPENKFWRNLTAETAEGLTPLHLAALTGQTDFL